MHSQGLLMYTYLSPNSEFFVEPELYEGESVLNMINSLGIRDREYGTGAQKDAFRVGVLGDSQTYGQGVLLEDTFVKRLENLLKDDPTLNRRKIEVVNLGNSGSNTYGQYLWYKEIIEPSQLDIDVMIWVQYSNDWQNDILLWKRYNNFHNKIAPKVWPVAYKAFLRLANFIRGGANPFLDLYWTAHNRYSNSQKEQLIEQNILEGYRQFQASFPDLKFAIFYLEPVISELPSKTREMGIPSFEIGETINLQDPENVLDPQWDHHLSPLGHERVARRLYVQSRDFLLKSLGKTE